MFIYFELALFSDIVSRSAMYTGPIAGLCCATVGNMWEIHAISGFMVIVIVFAFIVGYCWFRCIFAELQP